MTGSSKPVFLDTNILVYLFESKYPETQEQAEKLYMSVAKTGTATVSTQVLQEFYAIVTRKIRQPLAESTARLALCEFCEQNVVQVTPSLILEATRRAATDQLSLWDAMIVEAALAGGCRTLYTEDLQDGRTFGRLRVVNPFTAH